MRSSLFAALVAGGFLLVAAPAPAADEYRIDDMHNAVTFRISHMGLSWVYGRFNDISGTCTIDRGDPAACSFSMTIKAESIDTGNKARDTHLRSPDFFNVKQFPLLSFKSTTVKPAEGGYEVTGDLTMHGETKPVTFTLKGGKTVEFMGMQRTGFTTSFILKRSEFGITKGLEAVGDEVHVEISFEAIKR
jgi:polyisoprenoid-binding protein YceI